MSGHWRFCVAASLFFAGVSILPASSNPLTDLFNPAPKEAATPDPAPAKEACALRPGSSAAPGQHWFYHLDGHHKCWFQAAEAAHAVNKPVHHYAAKRPVIAPEENKVALHNRTVLDARDQLLTGAAADVSQPMASAPKVVDQASAPDNEAAPSAPAAAPSVPSAATPVPVAPIAAQPAVDQLVSDKATPHHVDVDMLLADSSLDKDTAASSAPSAAPTAPPIPQAHEDHQGLTASRAGMGLIVLGLVFLLGSLSVRRFLDSRVVPIHRV